MRTSALRPDYGSPDDDVFPDKTIQALRAVGADVTIYAGTTHGFLPRGDTTTDKSGDSTLIAKAQKDCMESIAAQFLKQG